MSEAENILEARRWFRYAVEDLQAASVLMNQSVPAYRHICWLAQQAAEKAIKTVLVYLQIDFYRTHDLDALRNLVPDDWTIKHKFPDLAVLTEWAVEARYPGNWGEANAADARSAYQQAGEIIATLKGDAAAHGIALD